MKKILLFFCIFFVSKTFAQIDSNKILYVKFQFAHSSRIPYHSVSVELTKFRDKVEVLVKSKASSEEQQWSYSTFEKRLTLKKEDYDGITKAIAELNPYKLSENFEYMLIDGYQCSIEFGNYSNSITYKIGGPGNKSNEESTKPYFKVCKMILKVAQFNPKEIL
ncbi:hypothetical protein [Ochrovirga pacifica]|uniref:hypothetical protein n=1 Tax=Ochrovirga pacifica TaxID=1042376 RepID=UPI000255A517|nr:hypothetical protein [Ochrovirga pacifica]